MPNYDRVCDNQHWLDDQFEPITPPDPPPACAVCGLPTRRAWRGKAGEVRDDSIPGGIMIEHGICNPDGTPRRYDSHSDIRRALKAAGLVPASESHGTRIVDLTDYDDPDVQRARRLAMAEFLGLTLDEYDRRFGAPLEARKLEKDMDPIEYAIRREVSLAELYGMSEDRPGSEQNFIERRAPDIAREYR